MRCVDIQHKQLCHLIVLFVEAIKTLIRTQKESDSENQTKRMYVLNQSVKVMQWINLFDPQNVNIDDLTLPNELKQLNDYSKQLISEFPQSSNAANKIYKRLRQAQDHVGTDSIETESMRLPLTNEFLNTVNNQGSVQGTMSKVPSVSKIKSQMLPEQ